MRSRSGFGWTPSLQADSMFVPDERPSRAIERAINQDSPDLVVMGTRGRTNAAAILLGNVTERTIRRTRVPLLAVKKKGEGLELLEAMLDLRVKSSSPITTNKAM